MAHEQLVYDENRGVFSTFVTAGSMNPILMHIQFRMHILEHFPILSNHMKGLFILD